MGMQKISRRELLHLCVGAAGAMVVACAPAAPAAVEKPLAVEKELSKEITECARDGDLDGVRSLIETGADVDSQDKKGMTPLLYAARQGHGEVAELLISKGADLAVVEPGARLTALHFCALRGHRDIAEVLISKGADVHAEDKTGSTPLHLAAYSGHREVAELLLSEGADIEQYNSGSRNAYGDRTPLLVAAEAGHADVVELLILKGADVNAKQLRVRGAPVYIDGAPLHLAAYANHVEAIELLISNGADINAAAGWGTPLDWAIQGNGEDAAELLQRHGGQRVPTPAQ